MLRKGDTVELICNKSKCLKVRERKNMFVVKYIPIGTYGVIKAIRKFNKSATMQYLVKFSGHSGFRHCEIDQIKGL